MSTSYLGSSTTGELIYRSSLNSQVPNTPLVNISDRLVADALRRASLTHRPSVVKYPPDYFNGPEDHSSSSDEEVDQKGGKRKKKLPAIVAKP